MHQGHQPRQRVLVAAPPRQQERRYVGGLGGNVVDCNCKSKVKRQRSKVKGQRSKGH
jgi:hypothetical protein